MKGAIISDSISSPSLAQAEQLLSDPIISNISSLYLSHKLEPFPSPPDSLVKFV